MPAKESDVSDLHTIQTFTTDEGVSVTSVRPTSAVVRHPVPDGEPACASEWKQFEAGGRQVEGTATLICRHGRMFVSPNFPTGFLAVLLHQRRVDLQAEAESKAVGVSDVPVLDFLAGRQKGTPPTTA